MGTPLRRAERLAGWVRRATPGLAVLVLIAALTVGHWAGLRAVAERAPDAHRTVATILEVTTTAYPDDNAIVPDRTTVRAFWTGSDGRSHVGPLDVAGQVAAGRTQNIWTDARGHPIRPPATGNGEALAAAVLLALIGGTALVGARVLTAAYATREGRRTLAVEWASIEPTWSGRDDGSDVQRP